MGFAMKTLNLSYQEVRYQIPWGLVLRMLSDQPRMAKKQKEVKQLSRQTAGDFKSFISQINSRDKKKR